VTAARATATVQLVRVPAAVEECGRLQHGLATPQQLRAVGIGRSVLSRALARGEVTRVRPGVYANSPLAPWPVHAVTHSGVAPELVQHVVAALLSLGDGATAGARTAACLRGWGLLFEPQQEQDVVVAHPRSRARLASVRVIRRRAVRREELRPLPDLGPVWVTTAVTTVLDCCRTLPFEEAVVVCDSALRSGQVELDELRAAASRLRGARGARRVRRVLVSCDPESGSVLESVLRVRMTGDGIVGFATQQVVRDAGGRHIVRSDFCFAAQRLVVETDGSRWHPDPARDQGLDNRLAAAGWRVLRFTWAQVVHDPAAVLALIRAALASGSRDTQQAPTALSAAA
jgi:very-short-patch-repair endonuclease